MPPFHIVWLVIMGLVWLVWVVVLFRVLFRLLRVSLERRDAAGAGYFGWLRINFGVYRDFFVDPQFRSDRNRVLLLTGLVFAVILARVWTLPQARAGGTEFENRRAGTPLRRPVRYSLQMQRNVL